jgi:hypothetical protein
MDAKQSEAEPAKDGDAQPAGCIVHDARGNAVWTWGSSGRTSNESTSSMLRRLELPGLKVEGQFDAAPVGRGPNGPHAPIARPPQIKPAASATDVKQGYNPYDQHVAIRKPTTPKGPVGKSKP